MKKFTITTPRDALILGLTLAITAPTEAQFRRAANLADSFARGMTPKEIENAKSAAQSLADEWAHEQSHTAPSRN
jgi:HAMP domain-containing protein